MEQDNGRRRSSRLAAKGITTPVRTESASKKPAKSVEKPTPNKRAKRKYPLVTLSNKKTKTHPVDIPKSAVEINENNVEKINATPMDVEVNESLPSSEVEKNEKDIETTLNEDNKSEIVENNLIDVDTEKKEEVADTNTITVSEEEAVFEEAESEKAESERAESEKAESEKAESEKAESEKAESEKAESVKAESEKAESEKAESEKAESEKAESETSESEKIVSEAADDEPVEKENTESLNNDVSQDIESKPDPVIVTENSNGNDDKEEEIDEEKLNNDVDVVKDVTPNGEVNEVESTNGNELEVVEQNNGDIETDLKAAVTATIPAANTILSNTDAIELENVAETVNVTPDDKAPNVDQTTTVVS